jgi:ParB-like nuclease domain
VLTRKVNYLEIQSIERNDELQARVALDKTVAEEYAADLKNGATFPPVVVFHDGERYWLVDGYHRTAARELLGHKTVLAEIREGSREDALWASVAANQTHGLRRTNADKHRSVERALLHPRAQRLSNRQIATHCGVHHYTVGRIRKELERIKAIEVVDTRQVTRDGSTYAQKILGIRHSNQERRLSETKGENAPAPAPRMAHAVPDSHDQGAERATAYRPVERTDSPRRDVLRGGPPAPYARTPPAAPERQDEIESVMRLLSEARKRLTMTIHAAPKTASGSEGLLQHLWELVRELERMQQQLTGLNERLGNSPGRSREPSGGGGAAGQAGSSTLLARIGI